MWHTPHRLTRQRYTQQYIIFITAPLPRQFIRISSDVFPYMFNILLPLIFPFMCSIFFLCSIFFVFHIFGKVLHYKIAVYVSQILKNVTFPEVFNLAEICKNDSLKIFASCRQ